MKSLKMIGAGLGVGGFNHTSNDAPSAFQHSDAIKTLKNYEWIDIVDERQWFQGSAKALSTMERLDIVAKVNTRLAKLISEEVKKQQRFCTIGGDHSCAIGTWSGAATAIDGDLGLIWVDAHMDSHTFETTYTQNVHGMPVAALLGHGHEKITHILSAKPKLKPENICLMGIRSFENEEAELLKKLGVTVYTNKDIEKHSLETLLVRAYEHVTRNTTNFGFSIDLDGFDPEFAPGTGTPVARGIQAHDFCRIVSRWANDPKLIGFEIAEYNPHLDRDKITENTMVDIISAFQKEGRE